MKAMLLRTSWMVVMMAALAVPQAKAQLSNAGFESGLSDWSQWQPGNTVLNSWGHSGVSSAAGWWQTSAWQDVTIANPNLQYQVGGWVFDDVAGNESLRNGAFASIRVEFKNASDTIVGTWTTGSLTGANLTDNVWNDLTAVITPSGYGAGITKATLVWEVNNSGVGDGRGIFDDLTLAPVAIPEASSMSMLMLGLAGACWFLRKRA